MTEQSTVYALKSFNSNHQQDGFLLVLNREKGLNVLKFLSELKMKKHEKSQNTYEDFGEVNVPDYIYNQVKNKSTFYVRSLDN